MKLPAVTMGLGVAVALGVAASLNAGVLALTPGTFGAMPTTGTAPGASGVIVASLDSGDVQDQPDLRFTTEVHSVVVSGDDNNNLGGLSLYYKIDNVADGATEGRPLLGLGIPFDIMTAQVEVDQDGSGNGADIVGLTAGVNSVGFVFLSDAIQVTESSAWLVVHTSFPSYKQGLVGVADGTVEDAAALVPVPEPTTYFGLFALSLVGIVAYRRFRG
jgi:hypothetical protein